MVDILTGTAFDARERMNHREDEVALEFPSSVGSRTRNLLALKAQNWKASAPTPPKPYDAEVEWIGVRGAQWFATGVQVDDANSISMEYDLLAASYLFGVGAKTVGNWSTNSAQQTSGTFKALKTSARVDISVTILGHHVLDINSSSGVTIDGIHSAWKSDSGNTSTGELLVGKCYWNGTHYANMNIFSFAVSRGGETILGLIPVRVGTVGFMYDRVSGQLFGNQGTGAFGIGPDI